MVESTCILHTSSHPDKYNNSVNRIISKEEEREDPRRDTSILHLNTARIHRVFLVHSTHNPASFQSSCAKTTILHKELILPQETSKKYYNYKAHPMQINTRHLSSDCSPCIQAFYTAESRLPAPLQHSRPTRH